ncbi:hypothetical protein C6P79_06980 [Burkholderia multivorans]|nr:hypothetical protein C6P79_06980 [Burkholderia multivorans]
MEVHVAILLGDDFVSTLVSLIRTSAQILHALIGRVRKYIERLLYFVVFSDQPCQYRRNQIPTAFDNDAGQFTLVNDVSRQAFAFNDDDEGPKRSTARND